MAIDPKHQHGQGRQEHDVSHIRNVGGAHEHRDINVRAIFAFLVTLTVVAFVVQVGLWGLFKYLKGSYTSLDPEPNPMRSGQRRRPEGDPIRDFPQPRLQADPVHDLNKMRQAENTILHGPPLWLDEQNGVVRIPIDQAMRLTLERGLPYQESAAAPSVQQKAARPEPSAQGKPQRPQAGKRQ